MSVLFILNPAAGRGAAMEYWERWGEKFLSAFPASEVWMTRERLEAGKFTKKALAKGFFKIVAVGGDGTFSEVVDGFLSSSDIMRMKTALGCLPLGSGSDFARHFNIPREPLDQVDFLRKGKVLDIDGGRAVFTDLEGRTAQRFFVMTASFGLAGDAVFERERREKRGEGKVSYGKAAFRCLASAKSRNMEIILDGRKLPQEKLYLGVLANTSMFGGGMKVAPGADPADGKFDFVSAGDMWRIRLYLNFLRIYSGTHVKVRGVSVRKVEKIEVSSPEEVYISIDGEASGKLPASFEIVPKSLPILVP